MQEAREYPGLLRLANGLVHGVFGLPQEVHLIAATSTAAATTSTQWIASNFPLMAVSSAQMERNIAAVRRHARPILSALMRVI
jgi:hypothetical protein